MRALGLFAKAPAIPSANSLTAQALHRGSALLRSIHVFDSAHMMSTLLRGRPPPDRTSHMAPDSAPAHWPPIIALDS